MRASERLPVEIKHLVFMEEVWRYTAPKPDYLADEYKCHLFYSTRPNPAYYVVDIDQYWDQQLYSDAQSIHVLPPLASTGVNRVARQKPSAVSETNAGDGKGSPLYRLTHDMWYMRWGDT